MAFSNFDPKLFLTSLIVTILSITLHEFGHAIAADKLGDPTPRRQGRVTLWPDKHFDIAGFIMIILTSLAGRGLGWGKPVEFNPRNLRNYRRDVLIIAIAGPIMNLLLALVFGLILRVIYLMPNAESILDGDGPMGLTTWGLFLYMFVWRNLGLMLFNLIPIHPLDGSKILGSLLPPKHAEAYDRLVQPYGWTVILIAAYMFPGAIGSLLSPAINQMSRLIIGF